MSRKVVWSARAQRDLQEQLEYIALDKPDASVRIGHKVIEATDLLGRWPHIGREKPGTQNRELAIPSTPFVAIYRQEAERTLIIRLMHGAQRR